MGVLCKEGSLTMRHVNVTLSPFSNDTPESSKGRTADSESANRGSNPCSGTNKNRSLVRSVFVV